MIEILLIAIGNCLTAYGLSELFIKSELLAKREEHRNKPWQLRPGQTHEQWLQDFRNRMNL